MGAQPVHGRAARTRPVQRLQPAFRLFGPHLVASARREWPRAPHEDRALCEQA
jgi:hypothetical protein